jgi:virulence-associated protein VapD
LKINSRNKGKRGELELSSKLKEFGFDTRRGQQYCGADGAADVVGLPKIHIEVKRVEHLNIYNALSQAISDAKPDAIPAVFHRKDRCEWLVSLRLEDFIEIYKSWYE